ncbi:hypothetical protein TVAG_461780 [Trichomonas vaginalis G3]|uniref:DUF3447 domain-containing protein n=1 Tax=Trichomonas vaginalis (strain ATCC PRA-98 / G3) TaxID=412133 RepID=A2FI52_TRIV3|nr:proteasome regulatory particle assembly [Trichomonas vaginalis G3]EAX95405.1 hypothetical protein TVAG_461780 [Trichomonas vaginalis G3]KAI5524128.1 proteasome regulatory particle assembly [Trichomonas vaginalis G3]|eukprot:XP_001308335.1 hypothetical protein [Trichomonas vaginalis G3]
MSDQNIHPVNYSELRSISKFHIDSYNALYQLKTENEEELKSIYKKIKTDLIDSKNYLPHNMVKDILDIIPFNNRFTKSYLTLAKFITDDYHVTKVIEISDVSKFPFYKQYGIKLFNIGFLDINSEDLIFHSENTIYKAIMYNNKVRFIEFTERDGFNKDQKLRSKLYPYSMERYSLLELCCYHGAVDCFKLLRTKFKSEITPKCLQLSFLGGNPEIMNECLKYRKPDNDCMMYAIISHNIDFVTYLMNEFNIEINLSYCIDYKNLESFLVYYNQTNDINTCFLYSVMFDIPSICECFISHGANINEKGFNGQTALHYAAIYNYKEIAELLISHGSNINAKENYGQTALHNAALLNNKEIAEFLISHGVNINEKDNYGQTALHNAALYNSKETAELLISHGANINEKNNNGIPALHIAILPWMK